MLDKAYLLFPENGLITHSNLFKRAGPGYVGDLRKGLENSLYWAAGRKNC